MSLLFCVSLYVPLELQTLPQLDALATQPVGSQIYCSDAAAVLMYNSSVRWYFDILSFKPRPSPPKRHNDVKHSKNSLEMPTKCHMPVQSCYFSNSVSTG